jgi:hypothetical protein
MSPRLFFNAIRIRNKNVFFHGAILAFFVISVIYTFIVGCQGFASLVGYETQNIDPSSSFTQSDSGSDYYASGGIADTSGNINPDNSGNPISGGRLLQIEI